MAAALFLAFTAPAAWLLSPFVVLAEAAIGPSWSPSRLYAAAAHLPMWVPLAIAALVAFRQFKKLRWGSQPSVFVADRIEISVDQPGDWGPRRRAWPLRKVTGVSLLPVEHWSSRSPLHPFTPRPLGYELLIQFGRRAPIRLTFADSGAATAEAVRQALEGLRSSVD